MAKAWRFKTKEEFIKENLWDHINGVPAGWEVNKSMNILLGTPLEERFESRCDSSKMFQYTGGWMIKPIHYTAKPIHTGTAPKNPTATTAQVDTIIVPGDEKPPKFNKEKLAKEIDEMFQEKLKKTIETNKELLESSTNTTKYLVEKYKKEVDAIFPDIKNALIAEIQRGHTTIILPSLAEIRIQEMDHPKVKDVIQSLHLQRKAMLVGPAGTGKTYMIADIAEHLKVPFYKYSCSRDSSVHDLLGYKQPRSETYLETTFLKAYEHGGIFLVDEYDAMSGDMALFFNGIADSSKFISIPHRDTAPIAEKHKDFYLVMCGNTWGKGSIDYSGRDFQDLALMDRFRFCRHHIGYHHKLEKYLMGDNYSFANNLRAILEKTGGYLSTRNIEDMSRLIGTAMPKKQIVEMLVEDLNEADKKHVLQQMVNHI